MKADLVVMMLLLVAVGLGCIPEDDGKPGEESGACPEKNKCNKGLACMSGVCVKVPEIGPWTTDAALPVDAAGCPDAKTCQPSTCPDGTCPAPVTGTAGGHDLPQGNGTIKSMKAAS